MFGFGDFGAQQGQGYQPYEEELLPPPPPPPPDFIMGGGDQQGIMAFDVTSKFRAAAGGEFSFYEMKYHEKEC